MTDQKDETAILRYVVRPESLAEHLELLSEVYAALDALGPDAFAWASYQIDGGTEFIEVATGDPLPGPLPTLAAFQRYRAGLEARCESRSFDNVQIRGSYRSDG